MWFTGHNQYVPYPFDEDDYYRASLALVAHQGPEGHPHGSIFLMRSQLAVDDAQNALVLVVSGVCASIGSCMSLCAASVHTLHIHLPTYTYV